MSKVNQPEVKLLEEDVAGSLVWEPLHQETVPVGGWSCARIISRGFNRDVIEPISVPD